MSITFGAIQLKSISVREPDAITTTRQSKVTGKTETQVQEIPLAAELAILPESKDDLVFNKIPGLTAKNEPNKTVNLKLSVSDDALLLTSSYQEEEKYMSYKSQDYSEEVCVGYKTEPAHKFYYSWIPEQEVAIYETRWSTRQVPDGEKTRQVTRTHNTWLKNENSFLDFHKLLETLAPGNPQAQKLLKLVEDKGKTLLNSVATKLQDQLKEKQTALKKELKEARAALAKQLKSKRAELQGEIAKKEAELKATEAKVNEFLEKSSS